MNETEQPIHATIGKNVYIAPTSYVGGEVNIGDGVTIMHHVTIRGDVGAITIGQRVNVQDGAILHTKTGVPLTIGDEVVIGHRAIVHCKSVGWRVLIGIGAIVLDDCEIGDEAIIAAGAVVPPGTIVPQGKLVVGVPGRVIREVGERERGYIDQVLRNYDALNREHGLGRYPNWNE